MKLFWSRIKASTCHSFSVASAHWKHTLLGCMFVAGMHGHGNEKLLRILVRRRISIRALEMKMRVGLIKSKSINQFPSEAAFVGNLAPMRWRYSQKWCDKSRSGFIFGHIWISATYTESLPGERIKGNLCNNLSVCTPVWRSHWCQMEAGIRSHFGKPEAIWTKSKRSTLKSKSIRKRASTEGGSSSAALMVAFVNTAQHGVISIAARGTIWHTHHLCGCCVPLRLVCTWAGSCGSITGGGRRTDIRRVFLALYADSLSFCALSRLPLRHEPAEG